MVDTPEEIRIKVLEAEVKRLREALIFYAEPSNWTPGGVADQEIEQHGSHSYVTLDGGWKARDAVGPEALADQQPEPKGST